MEPEIKNFADIVRLIKEDPARANTLVADWQKFEEQNEDTLPTNEGLLLGRDIGIVLNDLRDEDEDKQMQTNGQVDPSSFLAQFATLAALSLALHKGKKTLEEDKDYQKLIEKHKQLWLEKNNAKNFDSKEGLDYLHGSLEKEDAPTLKKDAEQSFRNDARFKKRIERYDKERKKIYKKLDEDPSVINKSYEIQSHTINRLAYLKTHEDTKTSEEMTTLIKKRSWERFATEHPEKAKAYAQTNTEIKKAYEKQEIKKQLADMEQKTGRQVRYVEKTHRPQDVSVEEAGRRLESIAPTQLRSILPEHRTAVSQTETAVGRGENAEISGRRHIRPQIRRVTNFGRQGTGLAARTGMAAGRAAGTLISSVGGPIGLIIIVVIVFIFIAVFIVLILEGGGGLGVGGGRRIPTFQCVDADGKSVYVTNGIECAKNYAAYYTKQTGATIPITANCLDKCSELASKTVCERNPASNKCDEGFTCGAPESFCFEYSVAAPRNSNDHSLWRHDCSNLDGFDYGAMLGFGVDSCTMEPPAPTPTP